LAAASMGDPVAVRAAAQEGRDLADAIGDGFHSRHCRICLGLAQMISGDLSGAVTQLGKVAAEAEAAHDEVWRVLSLAGQGIALAYQGEISAARAAADAAVESASELGGVAAGLGYLALGTVALAAGAMAAEQGVEGGLRAAGAGEQTIRGVRLAAAVVAFILLHRSIRSASSPAAAAESNAPKTALPEPAPNPQLPATETGLPAPADRGVWDLGPATRGDVIHERLGQNLPRSFPTVDIFKDGVVTSIKSIDLQAPSYRDTSAITGLGERFVNQVAGVKSARRAARRSLDAAV